MIKEHRVPQHQEPASEASVTGAFAATMCFAAALAMLGCTETPHFRHEGDEMTVKVEVRHALGCGTLF